MAHRDGFFISCHCATVIRSMYQTASGHVYLEQSIDLGRPVREVRDHFVVVGLCDPRSFVCCTAGVGRSDHGDSIDYFTLRNRVRKNDLGDACQPLFAH